MIALLVTAAFALAPTNGRDVADVVHPLIVLERAALLSSAGARAPMVQP